VTRDLTARDVPRAIRADAARAVAAGWTIRLAKHGFLFFPPDRAEPPASFPRTTSDVRTIKNWRAQMRRRGIDL
jgi:hypothetical protein